MATISDEAVVVLMVLTEEARIEPASLGQLGLGDHLDDAPVEIVAVWGGLAIEL